MPGKGGLYNMVALNDTYVDMKELQDPPEVETNHDYDINWVLENLRETFYTYGFLEIIIPVGVFGAFFYLFKRQEALNLSNMQIVLGSSFITFFFCAIMLYAQLFNSFTMFSLSGIVWMVSLIATVRDR